MELVSAAKMRRAVQNVLATRTYAQLGWQLLSELSARTDQSRHPLLARREQIKRLGLVIISSNRGLCGGFNHQLTHRTNQYIQKNREQNPQLEVDLVTVGKRGRDIMLRTGHNIVAEFTKADITTRIEVVAPIAKLLISDYLSGKSDRVVMAYTDFISPLTQKPIIKQLLPIVKEVDLNLGSARVAGVKQEEQAANFNYEYLFEPTPDAVLENLLPRLLEVQLYQALLESDASEHSARMMSMRNATDAAHDMISSLTLAFNQARQASITTELADITGGRAALGA
jgi:F-type H+-transporting ATPase subunit gamma